MDNLRWSKVIICTDADVALLLSLPQPAAQPQDQALPAVLRQPVTERVLRYALVNAAWNVVRNNATFKAYYDAKRSEGRSHYNALGHCAGKLVRVIWKMLTDEVEFNLE